MFGDLWNTNTVKTRRNLLVDFDQRVERKRLLIKTKITGQARAIRKIERFVELVLKSNKPAYLFKKKLTEGFRETYIGKRLKDVLPLTRMFGIEYEYSELPAIFIRAFKIVECQYGFMLCRPLYRPSRLNVARAEVMNALIDQIRHEAKAPWFGRFAYDRRYEAQEKARVMAEYVKALLRKYSKVLPVRVDLWYRRRDAASVTIDRLLAEVHELIDLRETDRLFKSLIGYAWAVEQSDRKGFHVHLVFFYNGSKSCRDVMLGYAIGSRWRDQITGGLGGFHNCNASKEKYDRCGIGMIHRNNPQECANAIEFMQYLVKGGPFLDRKNQYLRVKPSGRRTFGTGKIPEMPTQRLGRPAPEAPWLDSETITQ